MGDDDVDPKKSRCFNAAQSASKITEFCRAMWDPFHYISLLPRDQKHQWFFMYKNMQKHRQIDNS